jgi:DNA-directed RNA polymerase specialized sigma24 family protein
MLHQERRRRLENALEDLPGSLHEVVVGRVFQEETFHELADRLRRSSRVIRRQWAQAIRILAEEMRDLNMSSGSVI